MMHHHFKPTGPHDLRQTGGVVTIGLVGPHLQSSVACRLALRISSYQYAARSSLAALLINVENVNTSGATPALRIWHHGFRIPGAEELTLDHAYRAMIWLGEEVADGRTTTDAIEEDL